MINNRLLTLSITLFIAVIATLQAEPLVISSLETTGISQGQVMELINRREGLAWNRDEGNCSLTMELIDNERKSLVKLQLFMDHELYFSRSINLYNEEQQRDAVEILIREMEIYPLIKLAEAEELPELPELIENNEFTLFLFRGDKLLEAGDTKAALSAYSMEQQELSPSIQKMLNTRLNYCRRSINKNELKRSFDRADIETCMDAVEQNIVYTKEQRFFLIESLREINNIRKGFKDQNRLNEIEELIQNGDTEQLVIKLKQILQNLETDDIQQLKLYIRTLYHAHLTGEISELPIHPRMIHIKGGNYRMGIRSEMAEQGKDDDASPQHTVKLSSFDIAPLEVTAAEFCIVMNWARKKQLIEVTEDGIITPEGVMLYPLFYFESLQLTWDGDTFSLIFPERALYPIHGITWYGAHYYTQLITLREGRNFFLPTEAQWEYAAAGGKRSRSFTYSGSDDSEETAWTSENSWGEAVETGILKPNNLGIFDMSGNVSEWCNDYYDYNYYSNSESNNPRGPSNSRWGRVIRGGSAFWHKEKSRIISRGYTSPEDANSELGFRVIEILK